MSHKRAKVEPEAIGQATVLAGTPALIAKLETTLLEADWPSVNRTLEMIYRSGDAELIALAENRCDNRNLGEIKKRPPVYKLSVEEEKEFILRFIYRGWPEPVPRKASRGRTPTRTQYDEAADRRRGQIHELVRLPANRGSAEITRRKSGELLREQIKHITTKFPSANAREIVQSLAAEGLPTCTVSHVRKVLRKSRVRIKGE